MSKTITLQFCAFNSPMGKVIPWFTQGPVGHVDAVMDDDSLLGSQHEAHLGGMPAGVQIRPADYGKSAGMINRIRFSAPVTEMQYQDFWIFLRAQIGKPYDDTAIAAFVAGRDWHQPGAWVCSELIAEATVQAKLFPFPFYVPSNTVTPTALAFAWSAFCPAVRLPDYQVAA